MITKIVVNWKMMAYKMVQKMGVGIVTNQKLKMSGGKIKPDVMSSETGCIGQIKMVN